jgi:hypothetical protein
MTAVTAAVADQWFCARNLHAAGTCVFLIHKQTNKKSVLWAFLHRRFPWLAPKRRKRALSVCIREPPSQLGAAGALKAPGPARSRSAAVRTAGAHSQHSNGNSHIMALGDRRSDRITAGSALGCARGRHLRLGFGGAMRRSRAYHFFKMPFCTFFTCSQNTQMAPFSLIPKVFRPCLSKPSNGAPQWALMVRLMQKERLKSPHKSPFFI